MITIYTRKDLMKTSKNKPIEEIGYRDFLFSKEPFVKSEFVALVDGDKFKVIKNILPKPDYDQILPVEDLSAVIMNVVNLN